MKILLVEDDLCSAEILLQLLAEAHFTVDPVSDAKTAWQYLETYTYDLIILDVILPDSDGIKLCAKLRASGYNIPVLLLTAKDTTNDRVMGLEAGADDYMVKPYAFQELVARIRALLRRYRDRDTLLQNLTWEKIHLDLSTNIVTYNQQLLHLTQKEYGLLETFLRYPKQVFSRRVLLDRVWSAAEFPSEEAVTTHIKGLRHKLRAAGLSIDPIETLYGLGYRLKPVPVKSTQIAAKSVVSKPAITEPVVTESVVTESVVSKSVISKSVISEPVVSKYKEEPSSLDKARVQAVIAIMAKKLLAILPESIAILRRVAIALEAGQLGDDLRFDGYMEAHRLIGSLGSLGFLEGSALMRQMEQMLKGDFELVPSDSKMLHKLTTNLEASISDPFTTVQPSSSSSQTQGHNLQLPLLLIVDDDLDFVREVQTGAEIWGMRVQSADNLATAREKIISESPDVILLDIIFPNDTDNGLALLDELAQRQPKIPTVMISSTAGLDDRIIAARRGGCSFIEKPASTEEILNALSQVLQQQKDRPKVMIVDDDPISLAILQVLLNRWEIEVITLQNSKQFWQVLESTSPDLLILDLVMPEYSGIDLCQAVRTAPLWHDLPIVFLSTHNDRDTVRQFFAAGADDYLSKPVVETDLYTRILSRLERRRQSRQIADFDGLTGVYTHRRGIQSLTQLLRLATRNHQTLCVAILDLDFFKNVNDRYGHSMGDVVLKQFGKLLRQYFRSEDVTMRWGGEEFVIGLYGADLQQSVERLNTLLEIWRQQKFITLNQDSFSITFSAGVAEYPHNGANVESLYRNMDAALYQAKAAGRNQIVAASELCLK